MFLRRYLKKNSFKYCETDGLFQTELDRIGCRTGCSDLLDGRHDQLFVMARDEVWEAVYFVTINILLLDFFKIYF